MLQEKQYLCFTIYVTAGNTKVLMINISKVGTVNCDSYRLIQSNLY